MIDPRTFDADATSKSNFGDLPEWDLSDLYPGPESNELTRDMDWLDSACSSFATLDADGLLQAVKRYEQIDVIAGRLMSYAGLRYYQHTTDPERAQFMSNAQDKITTYTTPLVFYGLEFNRMDDAHVDALLAANADLARYKPVFDRMRAMKPYQLSDEMEKFLHDQSVVGSSAWNKLFDETIAGLTFTVDGETLNLEGIADLQSSQDRTKREASVREMARVLGENAGLFARVHNTLAKEKEIEDRWRGMPTPQTGRHLSNHVEPEVVEALRDAVVDAYPRLSHRYYALKAKWMGLDTMQVWDRNAFFTDGWIDAGVKDGKAPGAFAHPTVTTVHPYVMLNYLGKPRDVMTLAHELGHGVHQVLAAEQGELLSSTPLTLAETASVFGEMLTFRKLLDQATTQQDRKVLLAGKVEDMINTVVRQIAFYDFECKLHAARGDGELTPDDINALWMSVQGESLGPVFDFMDGYETFWGYIPHFVHSPFYVYAYAFGDGFGLDASDPAFWAKGLGMIEGMIDELEAMEV